MKLIIRCEIINLDAEDEEFKRPHDFIGKICFERTGRMLGCQSKNHTQCKGELWTCERCGIRICWEEGSVDLPELCDNCWFDVRQLGQPWEGANEVDL